VGLSPSPCHERIQKLERSKIIQGYHARLDYRRLANYSFFVTLVKITNYTTVQVRAWERLVLDEPAVVEICSLLGETDYLLKIAARNIEDYQLIVEGLFRNHEFTVQFTTHAVSGELRSMPQAKLIDTCQPSRE
ncbi:Lrp/AsnC family transcriptional regulator, partial [Steroidobacter sp.]|uniref:Lrp/AsnC family transcriptional regulator n=1 Tax=Steroidobacter sp. TaxID=1978227 RepID=UPI001A520C55